MWPDAFKRLKVLDHKSYYKAANLLVAMAKTRVNRGERQKEIDLIEKYRGIYPRHSAFKGQKKRLLVLSLLVRSFSQVLIAVYLAPESCCRVSVIPR